MQSTLQANGPHTTTQVRWLDGHCCIYDASVNANQSPLNLDAIEQDLADVDVALARLDADTYFTDEVTGEPLNEAFLQEHPTARRNPTPQ
jgi:RNA polymerase-binding transcription factor DksA